MRLPPRRVLTSNKRKGREGFDSLKPSPPPTPTSTTKLAKPSISQVGAGKLPDPVSSNQLLAGYLAHEYLTRGTLFGQPWDPARAEEVALEPKKIKPSQRLKEEETQPNKETYKRYVEVSSLLKAGGSHLPGVVNPSQLARFLQM
ncbi:hypothetical protein P3X46_011781 [Hevea brasiliensis]|uniref:Uncharacterized protein n=1 Tax=Hevea brasiliensis TaxID=3981 RepID=A0ABQ9MAH5_HEVBR|nr:uncharacterized protein LOC110653249 [Hevea brasiliensis]KAJ9176472.1 hypothetical protein P3X46_011781 [Hevea brasiliensis]